MIKFLCLPLFILLSWIFSGHALAAVVQNESGFLDIATDTINDGAVGKTYSAMIRISKSEGSPNVEFSISGLPSGIKFGECSYDNTGGSVYCYIGGTPVNPGVYSLVVFAQSGSLKTSQQLTLTILPKGSIPTITRTNPLRELPQPTLETVPTNDNNLLARLIKYLQNLVYSIFIRL